MIEEVFNEEEFLSAEKGSEIEETDVHSKAQSSHYDGSNTFSLSHVKLSLMQSRYRLKKIISLKC